MPENKNIHDSQFLNPSKILKDLDIEGGMRIADFGAGSGYMSFEAAEMVGSGGIVYALDINKSAIEHIKTEAEHRQLAQLKTIWTNLEMIGKNPIQDAGVDLVMIINMLFQSTKHYEILKEAHRVLKPGGRLVAVDWKKQASPFGPPTDERIDLDKFKEMAYNLRLNKISEFEAGPYHFGVIFKK